MSLRPFAVLRLITSSKFVGCSDRQIRGLGAFGILSVKDAPSRSSLYLVQRREAALRGEGDDQGGSGD